jgi:outer membrane receptor protein involved in Fe transport
MVAMIGGGTANAQDATQAGGLEEIVVTAQKRAENVQDVPIAISAFTASTLKERAVGDVSQLSSLSPNVNFDAGTPFSGTSAVLSAYIRGIGSDDFAFNIDPGVGVYIDGVFLARTVGANQDLLDVERIEVLKGPQGTLFGRNTIGGAISIVTRDPGDTFRFTGDATAGSYNLLQARGSADIPLADGIGSTITFGVKTRDGYLKRVPYPDQRAMNGTPNTSFAASGYDTSGREGGDDQWNLRGKLKFDRGGPFRLTLSGDYTKVDSSGLPNVLLGTAEFLPGNFAGEPDSNIPGTALDPTGTTGFLFAGLYNFCIGATGAEIAARGATALCGARGTQYRPNLVLPGFGSVNVDADPNNDRIPYDGRFVSNDIDRSYATGPSFAKLKNFGFAGTLEGDISDTLTVKSITAYRGLDWRAGVDLDGSPLAILTTSFAMKQRQFSQEVQLLGSMLDKKLNYVLGGYYFRETGNLHDFVTIGEGLTQVDGPNDFKTTNYAFFGQVDYRPIDLIGITIGGRYTHENKRFVGGQQDLNGFGYKLFNCANAEGTVYPQQPFVLGVDDTGNLITAPCQAVVGYPDPDNPIRLYAPGVNRKTFNNFSPKFGLQLHPNDDVMAYASWSKGYRTGGWTTRLTNPQPTAQDFNEETAATWEIGLKSTLFDRRLQLNLAAFTTDYKGIQLNFYEGSSPTVRNAGNARIKGFEIEAVAAPYPGLTLNAALGYVDARYTMVDPFAINASNVLQAGTFVGAQLPKTPKLKTSLSPRYAFETSGGGSVVLIADWNHASQVWNDAQRTLLAERKASDVFNASISFTEPEKRWSVTLGGTNLSNERYIATGNQNAAAGALFGTYNRPREWYARLGVNF